MCCYEDLFTCLFKKDFFFVVDPSKHNYQPRLFELSSATGKFTASEVLCPSRSEPKLCPFPFLQEDLYTAKQPGAEAKHSCYKTAQGNRNVRRFAREIRNEREREGRGRRDAFSINTPFPAFSSRTLLPLPATPLPLPPLPPQKTSFSKTQILIINSKIICRVVYRRRLL